jgi:hypothetical protein
MRIIHTCYQYICSVRSGRVRIQSLLQPFVQNFSDLECAVGEPSSRVAIVNMWCPLASVERDPLAFCDWRSITPRDINTVKIKYTTRTGETIRAYHSDRHVWDFFPDMKRGEVVLLKTWDSGSDQFPLRSRFALHCAASLSNVNNDAQPRASVEMRCMVLFHPKAASHDFLLRPFEAPHISAAVQNAALEIIDDVTYEDESPDAWVTTSTCKL